MNGEFGKQELKKYIQQAKPLIQDFLTQEVELSKEIGELPSMLMEDYKEMVVDGKGIRGYLVTLGYQLNGGKEQEKVQKASIFVELFHSGILIQDDFMDRDELRRKHETIHTKYSEYGKKIKVKTDYKHYGNALAVCLGDSGIYLSWKVLLNSDFSPESILRAGDYYSKYVIRLIHGQVLDLTVGANDQINEEDILKVLWTKSGEYTCLMPLMIGAALADDISSDKKDAIEKYAKCFGWAFQIQDDYLGTFSEEGVLGKPITSDLREGKNTLFMMHLRSLGSSEQLEFQKTMLGNENVTKNDVYKMREILEVSGVKDLVLKKGWDYVEEGKKYIPQITDDKNLQNILDSLIVYMMERTN